MVCKNTPNVLQLPQLDGNVTVNSDEISNDGDNNVNVTTANDDENSDVEYESDSGSETEYDTDDELDTTVTPLILNPAPNQTTTPTNPIQLAIQTSNNHPLCPFV